jgi:hypothetical protein
VVGVEYLTGVLLFLMIQSECTNEERAKSIHQMRNFIRREETAIRGNSTVFRKLWAFIEGVVDGSFPSDDKTRSGRGKRRKEFADDADHVNGSVTKRGKAKA